MEDGILPPPFTFLYADPRHPGRDGDETGRVV
jgi:hypothetical protein